MHSSRMCTAYLLTVVGGGGGVGVWFWGWGVGGQLPPPPRPGTSPMRADPSCERTDAYENITFAHFAKRAVITNPPHTFLFISVPK